MRSGNYPRLFAAVAGGLLALLVTAPAYAQETTIDINDDHVPTTAEDFDQQDCSGPFEGIEDDQDGWHFQLGAGGDSFVSVSLTFDTPDGQVDVLITSRDANNPDEGPGWSGYIGEAGGSGMFSHVWLVTDAGWTLTDGSAVVENPGEQDFFNLSHTCPGVPVEPTPTPTAEPTPTPTPTATPEPTPTATVAPSPTVTPTVPPGPQLPNTGLPVAGFAAVGAGLVAAGLGMLVSRRRRTTA